MIDKRQVMERIGRVILSFFMIFFASSIERALREGYGVCRAAADIAEPFRCEGCAEDTKWLRSGEKLLPPRRVLIVAII